MTSDSNEASVLRLADVTANDIKALLKRYGLTLKVSSPDTEIPGSFWGDDEAGLIRNQVYVRLDTPIHSILHESCHYICMSTERRKQLHTNAGGTQDEENAVCYLQLLLCNEIDTISVERMMSDMDAWGYNFMLGSCKAWFEKDAEDSKQWLINHKLISNTQTLTYQLRQ